MQSFKACSYLISITCLEEMNKYSVGICNVNALLNNKCIKYYRYDGNNTFNDLFEQYTIKYNIPAKYQLFVQIKGQQLQIIDKEFVKQFAIKNVDFLEKQFFLFDKRNIVLIKSETDTPVLASNDKGNSDITNREYELF